MGATSLGCHSSVAAGECTTTNWGEQRQSPHTRCTGAHPNARRAFVGCRQQFSLRLTRTRGAALRMASRTSKGCSRPGSLLIFYDIPVMFDSIFDKVHCVVVHKCMCM